MKKISALIITALLLSACTAQPAEIQTTTETETITAEITTTTETVTTAAETPATTVTTAYTPPQLKESDANLTYTGGISGGKTVSGIKNEALQKTVNDFIAEAEETLLSRKEEVIEMSGYITQNGELVKTDPLLTYQVSVTNGYISVVIGYVSTGMDDLHFGKQWYMCETAVFDIVSGERITDFSDLFADGFDWEEAIEKDLRQVTDVYLKQSGYDAEKILAGGYKFTAEEIIFPHGVLDKSDGNELYFMHQYWFSFISEGCKSNIPRDYSEFVTGEVKTKIVPETMEHNVIISGNIYGNRIAYSRVMTDEEIERENALYEKIQNEAVNEYLTATSDYAVYASMCNIDRYGDICCCYLGSYIERIRYCYDSDGNRLTLADLVNDSFDKSGFEQPLDFYEISHICKYSDGLYIYYYDVKGMNNQFDCYYSDGYEEYARHIIVEEAEMSDYLKENKNFIT